MLRANCALVHARGRERARIHADTICFGALRFRFAALDVVCGDKLAFSRKEYYNLDIHSHLAADMTKKQAFKSLYKKGVAVALVGALSGLTVGVVVTFFALAAEKLAEHSENIFELVRENPAFVPLLFLALAAGAFMVGTLTYLLPALGSNGVPQTEGVARGLLKVKWYQALPAMAAASLISMFMGLDVGAEGPCMFLGAMCGDGVCGIFKSTDMDRRYQITGGACAGVAVAGNAPLTGIVFALEEAHRRFTPSILVCSFSAVITAVITRNLLYGALGLEATSSLHGFLLAHMPAKIYLYVALAALVCGLIGVLLVFLVKKCGKLMRKITALKGTVKYLIPFLFAGVIGMIAISATGGGHSLINALATGGGEHEISLKAIFDSPIAVTLLALIIMRFVALVLNIGAGVPGGIFIPTLALGALVGALMSRLFALMGMDKMFADSIVLISMATMFATTVKAPLTAIIFVVEFTWQSTLLLPVVLGVFIGYMLSELFGCKPLYDLLLDEMLENESARFRREYTATIEEGSAAAGQAIRDVLWQDGIFVRSVKRDGNEIIPYSDMVLQPGDAITLHADVSNAEEFEKRADEIVKHQHHGLNLPHGKHHHAANIDKHAGDEASIDEHAGDEANPCPDRTEDESAETGNSADEISCAQDERAEGDILPSSENSTMIDACEKADDRRKEGEDE